MTVTFRRMARVLGLAALLVTTGAALPPTAAYDVLITRDDWGIAHIDGRTDADAVFVERMRRSRAVIIGKTNVPEFAAGSHTFNTVFGVTRNPVGRRRSVR